MPEIWRHRALKNQGIGRWDVVSHNLAPTSSRGRFEWPDYSRVQYAMLAWLGLLRFCLRMSIFSFLTPDRITDWQLQTRALWGSEVYRVYRLSMGVGFTRIGVAWRITNMIGYHQSLVVLPNFAASSMKMSTSCGFTSLHTSPQCLSLSYIEQMIIYRNRVTPCDLRT